MTQNLKLRKETTTGFRTHCSKHVVLRIKSMTHNEENQIAFTKSVHKGPSAYKLRISALRHLNHQIKPNLQQMDYI